MTIRTDTGVAKQAFEVWQYRELIVFFAWRQLKLRFANTSLGILWALLQPLSLTLMLALLVYRRGGFATGYPAAPDFVVLFLPLLLWFYFENTLLSVANSLTDQRRLLQKASFPRSTLLLGAVLARLPDYLICLLVFGIMLWWFDVPLRVDGLAVLLFAMLVLALLALSLGAALAPLCLMSRDVNLALPYALRLALFAIPVWYPITILPDWVQAALQWLPVVSVLETAKQVFFGAEGGSTAWLTLLPVLVGTLAVGVLVFRRLAPTAADYA